MAVPVEIFCCYSRKDQPLLLDLKAHLMPLQRLGLIRLRADTDITAGAEWEKEIDKHLNTAQIILLLISPAFMNSDYCYSQEMTRAIERHEQGEARVIPIIVRPVFWQGAPFGKLQALPTDAKAVTSRYWPHPDEAFFDVTEGIYRAIQEVRTNLEVRAEIKSAQEVVPAQARVQTAIQDTPPKQAQKTKEQWLEEGHRLRDLKQYAEALAACEQAIHLNPNYVRAYCEKGKSLNKLKRYEEALAAYEQAIHLNPDYAEAYYEKGVSLNWLDRYEEALAACEQAIHLNPDYAEAYCEKGKNLHWLDRYEEALAAREQAIRLNPNYAQAYYGKGKSLYWLDRYEEAVTAYEQAIRLNPNYAQAYYSKGNALSQLERKKEAQQAYKKARQLGYTG